MVQGEPSRRELPPSHHIARHCRRRDVRSNGTASPAAFELRPGEPHDPSHAGIFGYTEYNTDVAALLAQSVGPDEIHPAAA